jgi:hypothetical protein
MDNGFWPYKDYIAKYGENCAEYSSRKTNLDLANKHVLESMFYESNTDPLNPMI